MISQKVKQGLEKRTKRNIHPQNNNNNNNNNNNKIKRINNNGGNKNTPKIKHEVKYCSHPILDEQ